MHFLFLKLLTVKLTSMRWGKPGITSNTRKESLSTSSLSQYTIQATQSTHNKTLKGFLLLKLGNRLLHHPHYHHWNAPYHSTKWARHTIQDKPQRWCWGRIALISSSAMLGNSSTSNTVQQRLEEYDCFVSPTLRGQHSANNRDSFQASTYSSQDSLKVRVSKSAILDDPSPSNLSGLKIDARPIIECAEAFPKRPCQ